MKPTVGRIVHYVPEWSGPGSTSNPLPAIITEVFGDETVRLGVFGRTYYMATAIHLEPGETEHTDPVPGCWFWPPRSES